MFNKYNNKQNKSLSHYNSNKNTKFAKVIMLPEIEEKQEKTTRQQVDPTTTADV